MTFIYTVSSNKDFKYLISWKICTSSGTLGQKTIDSIYQYISVSNCRLEEDYLKS